MATTAQSTTAAALTVAELAHELRNELLRNRDAATQPMGEGVGAMTYLITAWAAWTSGSERRKAAQRRDPRSARMRAADKARVNLATGARVIFDGAAALVQSASRTGIVHRVEGETCTCEARGACWHLEAVRQARQQPTRRAERVAAILTTLRARRQAA